VHIANTNFIENFNLEVICITVIQPIPYRELNHNNYSKTLSRSQKKYKIKSAISVMKINWSLDLGWRVNK